MSLTAYKITRTGLVAGKIDQGLSFFTFRKLQRGIAAVTTKALAVLGTIDSRRQRSAFDALSLNTPAAGTIIFPSSVEAMGLAFVRLPGTQVSVMVTKGEQLSAGRLATLTANLKQRLVREIEGDHSVSLPDSIAKLSLFKLEAPELAKLKAIAQLDGQDRKVSLVAALAHDQGGGQPPLLEIGIERTSNRIPLTTAPADLSDFRDDPVVRLKVSSYMIKGFKPWIRDFPVTNGQYSLAEDKAKNYRREFIYLIVDGQITIL